MSTSQAVRIAAAELYRELPESKPTDGTKANPHVAYDWPDAYSRCRDNDRPMWFTVNGELGKCFPSGRFESATGR